MAVMGQQATGNVVNASFASTDEIDSGVIWAAGKRGVTVFTYATQSGTLSIDYIDSQGNVRAGSLVSSRAISANTLYVDDFDYQLPRFKIRFTPDAATAGTLIIDAYEYGS